MIKTSYYNKEQTLQNGHNEYIPWQKGIELIKYSLSLKKCFLIFRLNRYLTALISFLDKKECSWYSVTCRLWEMTIATDNNITFTFELDNYHLTVEVRNDTVVIVAFEKSDNSFTSFCFWVQGYNNLCVGWSYRLPYRQKATWQLKRKVIQ